MTLRGFNTTGRLVFEQGSDFEDRAPEHKATSQAKVCNRLSLLQKHGNHYTPGTGINKRWCFHWMGGKKQDLNWTVSLWMLTVFLFFFFASKHINMLFSLKRTLFLLPAPTHNSLKFAILIMSRFNLSLSSQAVKLRLSFFKIYKSILNVKYTILLSRNEVQCWNIVWCVDTLDKSQILYTLYSSHKRLFRALNEYIFDQLN